MTDWPGNISAITDFAEDVGACKTFYTEAFGLPVYYEDDASAVFQFGNTLINLLTASEAPDLIAPAVPGDADAGPRQQFTIDVDDVDNVDATAAELAARGVTLLSGPLDRPWGIRTAAFRDPAGTV
jgi:catechol 2,3-dioxygenase-like lactoylglutathione lyase family enzyme